MNSILGIGNAITDIYVSLPDSSLLERFSITPGCIVHVGREMAGELLEAAAVMGYPIEAVPGGSAANTVCLGAQLGLRCGFIGKVGADRAGDEFIHSLSDSGAASYVMRGAEGSGVAILLFLPGAERTLVVSPGAALELVPDELDPEIFAGYGHLHVEGFVMECPGVAHKAMQLAKELGLTVSFDLGSRRIAQKHNGQLRQLIGEYADFVFATQEETTAYTGPDHKGIAPVTIVKCGAEGSVIYSGEDITKIKAYPSQVVDTFGAGDAYAAGFLNSFFNGLNLAACGEAGSRVAAEVIGKKGARLSL